MIRVNEHYLKLKSGYLFPEIARRVKAFETAHSEAKIIRLGIGDVTRPLSKTIVEAFHRGVDEMANGKTFKGYGPEQGYAFLREAIALNDYRARGIAIDPDEIFVSDGSKCDTGNILDIFGNQNTIAVPDPVYPVYVDTNVMAGRTGEADETGRYAGICYLPMSEKNGFTPELPKTRVDLVYLCSPNNPTGATLSHTELKKWVAYARENRAILLFDAAYEAFIGDPSLPRSIYEIEGANEVAIEFRSFSKTAGFTGTRCAFTVVPKALCAYTETGEKIALNPLWLRRHTTKFNGVSYPVQLAALACYSENGKREIKETIDYYMENAKLIRDGLRALGFSVYGGENAPYIWLKTPKNLSSWAFFDLLLEKANVVGTPGSGFGACGEGFFRLSAFGSRESVLEALKRIQTLSHHLSHPIS